MTEKQKPIPQDPGADTLPDSLAALTEDQRQLVDAFADRIDLNDPSTVLLYGAACQKKAAAFSDSALSEVRGADHEQTGRLLEGLMAELETFSRSLEGWSGFFDRFRSRKSRTRRRIRRYEQARENIDGICQALEAQQNQLLVDSVMLEKLYEANLDCYRELNLHILAGRQKLEQARRTILPELRGRAEQTGQEADAQRASGFADLCARFEKKLHDLELTRTVSIQMAPQIRLIQRNNALMSEKIGTTLGNTVPLWKNQMTLALGLAHTEQALQTHRRISKTTDRLLHTIGRGLKNSARRVSREDARSIGELKTLRDSNARLMGTLDEVLRFQAEGRQSRQEAESELLRIETELKTKLFRNGTAQ